MSAISGVKSPTLADVRRILQRDGKIDGLTVTWVMGVRTVTYPRGGRGYIARVHVAAPGYRARTMGVDRDENGTRIF